MESELIVRYWLPGPFRLRPLRLTDVDLIRKAAQDLYIPLITTIPAVFTEDDGRQFIERQWSRAQQGTGYSFAIADAASDRAGRPGRLWLQAIGQGRAEVGYWVTASARGRGAAAHAVAAIAGWPWPTCAFPA